MGTSIEDLPIEILVMIIENAILSDVHSAERLLEVNQRIANLTMAFIIHKALDHLAANLTGHDPPSGPLIYCFGRHNHVVIINVPQGSHTEVLVRPLR
ncbi:hypothetical protein N7492_002766 [Penicillium capsulatum]|uniref:F-box domain-containing protein n=1 Tax=Penicillium capsulatum TaxID=69766 RepID=A0A9W9ILZ5_9EURO|nr:hypothetical protein N7492_002766 [Penicillium capsulatum]KAJ6122636.1 hypothetical protein N7512_005101 [Penicillium capsulatum]